MAREKKKESSLTPEEKMVQALVPDWEQPYKVPQNWIFVKLYGVTTRIKRGKAPKYVETSDYPVFAQKCNQKDGTISIEKAQFLNPLLAEKFADEEFLGDKDIVINSTGTGTLGRVGLYKSEYALPYTQVLPDSHITVVRPIKMVNPQYLFYFLKNSQEYLELQGVGSTNQKELRPETIAELAFPLPPVSEQTRIVDRIEYLFAKLDEAKEKAQSVLDSFETRKAAILHKAFTGELTAKWREQNGLGVESRNPTKIGEIVKLLSGQDFKPEAYNSNGNGIPYITGASNFDNDHVIINRWTSTPTVIAQRADVLLVCKGSGFGKVIIADFETAHIARQIMALRVKTGIDARFIYYFLQSEYEYLRNNGQGLIPGISRSVVINLPINLPVFSEQIQIVRILDSLLTKEQQAKEAAEAVLEKIDLLKKAILACAFRGELGTNDPAEPSAIELIKQILSEKIVVTEPKKPRKIKTPEVDFVAKTIMQALASGEKLTPEKLKAETDLQIDDFYDQLKILIDNGQVVETRVDGEAYLEAKNADRQPNN